MGGEARGEGGKEKRGGDGRGGGCGVESGGEREWVEKWRGNLKDRYEGKMGGKNTCTNNTHSTNNIHTPAGLWPSKPGRTWIFHGSFFWSTVVHIYLICIGILCIGRLTVNGGDIIVTHNVHTDGFPAVN